jgi:hypothetical protein
MWCSMSSGTSTSVLGGARRTRSHGPELTWLARRRRGSRDGPVSHGGGKRERDEARWNQHEVTSERRSPKGRVGGGSKSTE